MRLIELLSSIILIIIFTPIIIPVVAILSFTGEKEIFFLQERIGHRQRRFKIIKFATMLKDSPNIGAGTITERNDPRILPFGHLLRKTKLNEIPQLLNIAFGQMGFVGPRPCVERDLVGITDTERQEIWSVRPGITGISSIIFRDEEQILHSEDEPRLFYDLYITPYKKDLNIWYARNKNLWLDVKLIIITAFVVLFSNSKLVFTLIKNLPEPPKELRKYVW